MAISAAGGAGDRRLVVTKQSPWFRMIHCQRISNKGQTLFKRVEGSWSFPDQNNLQQEGSLCKHKEKKEKNQEEIPYLSLPNFSARHCDLHNKSITALAKKISYAIQALSKRIIYTAVI